MPYTAGTRVRVTNMSSQFRGKHGRVMTTAADTGHGYNEVRIDGAVGRDVALFGNVDLGTSGGATPFNYGD